MIVELIAIGSELLLGQMVDTNTAWLAGELAAIGAECYHMTTVGDNHERIVAALGLALQRSDAVVTTGGLGPTQDDVTREAVAEVMGANLVANAELAEVVRERFASRGRQMAANNLRQAEVPEGASVIEQRRGTAPGLACPVGAKVVYALPGVPYEMEEMFERAVAPDLLRRSGEKAVIASRVIRTWGLAESDVAERLTCRLEALDTSRNPTLAFLASGIEGIKVRITAKAGDRGSAESLLDTEEAEVRAVLGTAVFGVDGQTIEHAVGELLVALGWSLGLAESLTGGLSASRMVAVEGASRWFKGSLVTYSSRVKRDLLGVPGGPVVSAEAAEAMAVGAARALRGDVGLSLTGVAGPGPQEGVAPGTVYCGLKLPGETVQSLRFDLPGDRERVRQFACISAVDALRRRLMRRSAG